MTRRKSIFINMVTTETPPQTQGEQLPPEPQPLNQEMQRLFDLMATQFENEPRLEMDYYSRADFESRPDRAKSWLDKVGSEPSVRSLQELLDLLKRAQDWRRPDDIKPPGALPYRVTADDPECLKPPSYKLNAQWWGEVRSVPADSDHSNYSLIKLFRNNQYIPDKQQEGQFVYNPHGVDLELSYNSGGIFGENQVPAHLTVHNHVNGQRATFMPKLT